MVRARGRRRHLAPGVLTHPCLSAQVVPTLDLMDPRDELRDFLQTRRARLTPDRAGIASYGPRRVPGLRREEVAQLAGVSTDYDTRLEKGKVGNPSDSVLEAVSRVLELDQAEHTHLLDLVRAGDRPSGPMSRPRPGGPAPRPSLQWRVDAMSDAAAMVVGPFLDVVAMNHLARALYAPMLDGAGEDRLNFARFAFLDPAARELYPDWDGAARVAVAQLRLRPRLEAEARARGEELPLRMWGYPWLTWATLAALAGLVALMLADGAARGQLLATGGLVAVVVGIYGVTVLARRRRAV